MSGGSPTWLPVRLPRHSCVFLPTVSLQYPSFQTERSESDQDSPWGSSPLTDSASPQLLEQSEGLDASCVYRQFSDPRTLCYSPSEEQRHAHLNTHGQGQRCERGRCEAGRYFLGAPPPSSNLLWGSSRSILPLSKSSLENHDGYDSSMPHITAIHSYNGQDPVYIYTNVFSISNSDLKQYLSGWTFQLCIRNSLRPY